jgi:signal transduction histidine kinase
MAVRDTSFAVPDERPSSSHDRRAEGASMRQVAILARDLVSARTQEEAVAAAIEFCASGLDAPAAVWVDERGAEGSMRLAGVWGLGSQGRRRVESGIPTVPRDRSVDVGPLARQFERLSGVTIAGVIRTGPVFLLHGRLGRGYEAVIDAVAGMLTESLARLDPGEEGAFDERHLGLAMTAHELRSPLLGARAAVERLLLHDGDLSDDLGLLRAAERELAGLSERVEQLLRWAVGSQPPQCRPQRLASVATAAVDACSDDLEHGRVRIRVARDSRVTVDATHLRAAIENLIRNALAYSPSPAPVSVTVDRAADVALVRVRDHGPGIDLEERSRMFEPLQRGSHGRMRRGSGLGLFIAKRVVDAHGGAISVRSAPGGGSVFRIALPLES